MKLTWRRILCERKVTPTGRPSLSHYQSNKGHKIFLVTDVHGRVRGYIVELKGKAQPATKTLYQAKWQAEHRKKW
jgi:hypothetical protein